MLSAGTASTDQSGAVLWGVVEALRAGECVCVCVPTRSEPNNGRGERCLERTVARLCGGCGAGDCAAAGDGVAAYDDGDYGDEAFGVGDCGFAGLRQRDTTTMVEALADATGRSWSPGVIEWGA